MRITVFAGVADDADAADADADAAAADAADADVDAADAAEALVDAAALDAEALPEALPEPLAHPANAIARATTQATMPSVFKLIAFLLIPSPFSLCSKRYIPFRHSSLYFVTFMIAIVGIFEMSDALLFESPMRPDAEEPAALSSHSDNLPALLM